ncbi:hypothetical protein EMGBS1_07380, partial [Chloroflexota bacterium]
AKLCSGMGDGICHSGERERHGLLSATSALRALTIKL